MSLGPHLRRYFRARNARRRARTADGTFPERKAERRDYFMRYVFGRARTTCVACGGSGHYDNDGSPLCGGCDGKGWDLAPGPKVPRFEG